jgi:hypothetical protein
LFYNLVSYFLTGLFFIIIYYGIIFEKELLKMAWFNSSDINKKYQILLEDGQKIIGTIKQIDDIKIELLLEDGRMKKFKDTYGKRAVLSNHGLQENLTKGALVVYKTFRTLGGAIAVQTKSPVVLTDQAFRVGLSYGVSEFEIWDSREAGGYADFTTEDLQRWKDIIEN